MAILERSPVEDKRDPMALGRRPQLISYAREMGQADIDETMPATVIRSLLTQRGLRRGFGAWAAKNAMHARPLGSIGQAYMGHTPINATAPPPQFNQDNGQTINADDDMMRQYKAQQERERQQKNIDLMSINQLRDACKRRGIKLARRDNIQSLRAKLNEQITP
jgi:hypothetical protein